MYSTWPTERSCITMSAEGNKTRNKTTFTQPLKASRNKCNLTRPYHELQHAKTCRKLICVFSSHELTSCGRRRLKFMAKLIPYNSSEISSCLFVNAVSWRSRLSAVGHYVIVVACSVETVDHYYALQVISVPSLSRHFRQNDRVFAWNGLSSE